MANENRFGRLDTDQEPWMYSRDELEFVTAYVQSIHGALWLPEGHESNLVKRCLGSAMSASMSLLKSMRFSTDPANQSSPILFVLRDGSSEDLFNAYATELDGGRSVICVGIGLVEGFADLLQKLHTGSDGRGRTATNRYAFSLAWGLRWRLFHEIAHLGFHHLGEMRAQAVREVNGYAQLSTSDHAGILERRCQEAEADLWATHMTLRDSASQYYQILLDDGSPHGLPFSNFLLDSMVVLFSYFNDQALTLDDVSGDEHPHPQTRATLTHWYALRVSRRMAYFAVDWHYARNQLELLSELFQFSQLPNILLCDQEDRIGDLQTDLNSIHKRVVERAMHAASNSPAFRLEV